jgi:dTDP-4-dehydrorhamnose reductase
MITLFGHGYIGSAIADYLENNKVDFRWYSHKDEQIISSNIIINASGYTGKPNVDACEDHKEETIEGNILWPLHLQAKYSYVPIIHISSGCIYNGYTPGGWTEKDVPNFTGSFYSMTKVIEQKNLDLTNSYLLRIRMPFEKQDNPRNYLTKLKNYPKLINAENSLSHLEDIAATVLFFAKKFPEPGIYNVCNPGSITAKEIVKMMNLKDKEWVSAEKFEKMIKAPRSFCTLNVDKLMKIFPIPDVRERIRQSI